MINSDRRAYSLTSATNSGTGSAIDSRATRGYYAHVFVTGGTAVVNIQASHSLLGDSAWLPVQTVTALDGVGQSSVSLNYYPYLRGFTSGYAGATASVFIAPGVQ